MFLMIETEKRSCLMRGSTCIASHTTQPSYKSAANALLLSVRRIMNLEGSKRLVVCHVPLVAVACVWVSIDEE